MYTNLWVSLCTWDGVYRIAFKDKGYILYAILYRKVFVILVIEDDLNLVWVVVSYLA